MLTQKIIKAAAGITSTLFLMLVAVDCLAIEIPNIENPLGESSEDFNFEQVVNAILDRLTEFIAGVAILVFIIAGFYYIFSQGKEDRVTTAKKIMTGAIIGLVSILAARSILKEVYQLFSQEGSTETDSALSLSEVVTNILNFLLQALGIIAIIALVVGGIRYLTSGGNTDLAQKARKQIIYALIGLVIALSSLIIVKQIDVILQGVAQVTT